MKFHFIVDANLPPDLVTAIRKFDCEATHVFRLGIIGTLDAAMWNYAADRNAVVISRDQDFANRARPDLPPGLVWIRWRNTRRAPLITRLTQAFPKILSELENGEWYFELVDN
jgi:predicted nuclease of predicted toxin-antitoxin system